MPPFSKRGFTSPTCIPFLRLETCTPFDFHRHRSGRRASLSGAIKDTCIPFLTSIADPVNVPPFCSHVKVTMDTCIPFGRHQGHVPPFSGATFSPMVITDTCNPFSHHGDVHPFFSSEIRASLFFIMETCIPFFHHRYVHPFFGRHSSSGQRTSLSIHAKVITDTCIPF